MKYKINKEPETKIVKEKLRLSQDEYIQHFNKQEVKMISAPDVINLEDKKLISSIHEDFEEILVTSTQIDYKNNTVTHDTNSTVVKPTVIQLKEIPVCWPTYIRDLVATESGLQFTRALLNDMKLTPEQVIAKFESISGKKPEDIRFWIPDESERKQRPLRAVQLCFFNGRFSVVADWWTDCSDYRCVSRGVRVIDSAPKEQSKSEE